jgi:hypothetical protein
MDIENNNNKLIIKNFYNTLKNFFEKWDSEFITNQNLLIYNRIDIININNIIGYNIKNEIIFENKFQIIGIINRKEHKFNWSWSIVNINDDLKFYSKEIFNYGLGLSKENSILKYILTQTSIDIKNVLYEDFIMAIVITILKKKILFRVLLNKEKDHELSLICFE